MTAQPADPVEESGEFDVIHLGGESAVVVPMSEFRRLRALERIATPEELEDAEDLAAMEQWRAEDAAGLTTYVPWEEVKRRLGFDG